MTEKHSKIVVLIIIVTALWAAYHFMPRRILRPKIMERETAKFIRQTNAPGKTVQDIEKKLSQEEIEYNRAKMMENLKRKKYDILAFEYSLSTAEKPAAAAWARFEKEFSRWQEDKTDISGFFKTVDFTKDELEKVKNDLHFIRVPEGISGEVDSLLAEAKIDLLNAYSKKNEALDYILRFIDENKPSYQYKFNENLKRARKFASEAMLNIIEAKKKIGLEFFPEYETKTVINTPPPEPCNCTIQGISLANQNQTVFTSSGPYRISEKICSGTITKILSDKVTISFSDGNKEYAVGDTVNR